MTTKLRIGVATAALSAVVLTGCTAGSTHVSGSAVSSSIVATPAVVTNPILKFGVTTQLTDDTGATYTVTLDAPVRVKHSEYTVPTPGTTMWGVKVTEVGVTGTSDQHYFMARTDAGATIGITLGGVAVGAIDDNSIVSAGQHASGLATYEVPSAAVIQSVVVTGADGVTPLATWAA